MKDLIKRLEHEINKTPTNELRNLLCDINIILHQSLLKIFTVDFAAVYPTGNGLVLVAHDKQEAEKMAQDIITHTDVITVNELVTNESQIIMYIDGDY